MAREHAAFQPFHILLDYQLCELDPMKRLCEIYARGPSGEMAVRLAQKAWNKYVKASPEGAGVPEDAPWPNWREYDGMEMHKILVIDDGDYLQQWKVARSYKRFWVGVEENPICFAYFPDGQIIDKLEDSSLILPEKPSGTIFLPP